MAWGQKYELAIYDKYDIPWFVQFFKDGWEGAVTTLKGGISPISFNHENESDDVFGIKKQTTVTLSIHVTRNFMYKDIVTFEQMSTYVEIRQFEDSSDVQPYWSGYVDPSTYQEPYDVPPYSMDIDCIDGLSLLQSMVYAEQSSEDATEYYTGYRLESQIVLDLLGKIGFTEFKEYINIYEDRMDNSVDDSPYDQIYIDTEVFSINKMNCEDVFKELLKKYNACIRQINGVMCIYRPCDLINYTVYGRHFTAAETKTSISYNPLQYISRTDSHLTDLRQVPGCILSTVFPVNKVKIVQDYGYRDSWIRNWQVRADSYDEDTSCFLHWTAGGGWTRIILPTIPDGIVFNRYSTGAAPEGPYVSQSFGTYAVPETTALVFSFSYRFSNFSGATRTAAIYVRIKADNANQYLYFSDSDAMLLAWQSSSSYVSWSEADIEEGIGEWKTFEGKALSLPVEGPYTITIWGPQFSTVYSDFHMVVKDIKFYVTSDTVMYLNKKKTKADYRHEYPFWERVWKGHPEIPKYKDWLKTLQGMLDIRDVEEVVQREYSAFNDIEGDEISGAGILGDIADTGMENVMEQFAGALVVTGASLAAAAIAFYNDNYLDYYAAGVTISVDDNVITFTENNGSDFSGDTSIDCESSASDLEGDVATTQAHAAGTEQVATITLTGTGGTANITVGGVTMLATFNGTLAQTAQDFIDAEISYGYYAYAGIEVTKSLEDIIFTEAIAEGGFGTASIANVSGDLDGTLNPAKQTAGVATTLRIDTITLRGAYGQAWIICDEVQREITVEETPTYSETWNTRYGGSEDAEPLLQKITDETAYQYSRSKYKIDINIQEMPRTSAGELTTEVPTDLNMIGCFVDDVLVDDSDFPVREASAWVKSDCEFGSRIDIILLSGTNGACEFGTELGVKEVSFTTNLAETAEKFVEDFAADLLSINNVVVSTLFDDDSTGDVYLVFKAAEDGFDFTTVVNRTGGSLDGEITTIQDNDDDAMLNYACYFSTADDSHIAMEGLALDGSVSRIISIRYKIIFGTWGSGQIFYATASHGRSASYQKNITLIDDGQWHTLLVDMSDLDAGGSDWVDSIITDVWFDLTDEFPVGIDLEWIGFARMFVANRGTFDVRNRRWELDLMEIIR